MKNVRAYLCRLSTLFKTYSTFKDLRLIQRAVCREAQSTSHILVSVCICWYQQHCACTDLLTNKYQNVQYCITC